MIQNKLYNFPIDCSLIDSFTQASNFLRKFSTWATGLRVTPTGLKVPSIELMYHKIFEMFNPINLN